MRRRLYGFWMLALTGCVPTGTQTQTVPANPFAGPLGTTTAQSPPTVSPATEEASLRVSRMGQKILAANPRLAIKPAFSTVGASPVGQPAEEIFHTADSQVYVTETLVRKCQTD